MLAEGWLNQLLASNFQLVRRTCLEFGVLKTGNLEDCGEEREKGRKTYGRDR